MRGAQVVLVSSFETICDLNCCFIFDFIGLWEVENCHLIKSFLGLFWRILVNLGMLR
jgi:hypothetical protein